MAINLSTKSSSLHSSVASRQLPRSDLKAFYDEEDCQSKTTAIACSIYQHPVTLIEERFCFLVFKFQAFFLIWKLVCHRGQQISGFANVHCAVKDTASEGSVKMKVSEAVPGVILRLKWQTNTNSKF